MTYRPVGSHAGAARESRVIVAGKIIGALCVVPIIWFRLGSSSVVKVMLRLRAVYRSSASMAITRIAIASVAAGDAFMPVRGNAIASSSVAMASTANTSSKVKPF